MTAGGQWLRTLIVITANSAMALGCVGGLVSAPAAADNWIVTPSATVRETYTNNANLSGQAQSSFVTSATAAIVVNGTGARVQLNGSAAVQGLLYLGDFSTNTRDNSVFVRANLLGNVEAVERFFFIEGAVNVSQQYFSPFAAQPDGNIGVTDNRYTAGGFRLSPYIRGVFRDGTTYLLRNDNIWVNLGYAQNAQGAVRSYVNRWTGLIASPIRTFGWRIEGNATSTTFTNEQSLNSEIVRGYLDYRPDPQVLLYGIGGYEWNDYFLTKSNNAVYGVGGEWRPTERTVVRGSWQERFFGSEYLAAVTHRNPFTAFNVNATRNITTYPQQLFAGPAGGDVAALVDAALTTRIPDPVQREQAVQTFLSTSGLPSTLQSPLNFYTQQVILYEQQSATFTLLGVRNSTAFTLYNRESEAISGGSGVALPPVLAGSINNNTQRGASVAFSHRLTPIIHLNAIATHYETIAAPPFTAKSTTDRFVGVAGARLSPKTDAFTGLTYTEFTSNVANDYNAFTLFVGFRHVF